jgi:hypothetical protein
MVVSTGSLPAAVQAGADVEGQQRGQPEGEDRADDDSRGEQREPAPVVLGTVLTLDGLPAGGRVTATLQDGIDGHAGDDRGHGQEDGAAGAGGGPHCGDEQRADGETGIAPTENTLIACWLSPLAARAARATSGWKAATPTPDSAIVSEVSR